MFLMHNIYYGVQLAYIKAERNRLGWFTFCFIIGVNYFQLAMLVEVNPNVYNVNGWFCNALFWFSMNMNLGPKKFFNLFWPTLF